MLEDLPATAKLIPRCTSLVDKLADRSPTKVSVPPSMITLRTPYRFTKAVVNGPLIE